MNITKVDGYLSLMPSKEHGGIEIRNKKLNFNDFDTKTRNEKAAPLEGIII